MRQSSFSLVIPAYNEEKRIESIVKAYYAYLKKNFADFEIVLACNNCKDSTEKIAKALAKSRPGIRVLNFPHYTGKGGAVIKAFKTASKEILGFTDCDGSTQPKEFDKLFAEIAGFDAVIGSRAVPESRLKRYSILRVFLGKTFSLITKILFRIKFNDTQCGAKIFKKKALKSVLQDIKTVGWAFDVEILWKLQRKGFKIKEVGITWQDSTESKLGFSAPISMFWQLLKMRFS